MKVQAKSRVVIRRAPKDGEAGMTLQLVPDRLVLDTDTDGIVKDFTNAACLVQVIQGTTVLTPAVLKTLQVHCAAQITNNTVKITGISVDPETNYSFGSGYVDIIAIVNGKFLKGRLNVEINIHRAVAKLEKSNKEIVAEVDTLDKKVTSHKESIARLAVRQGEIDLSVKELRPASYAKSNVLISKTGRTYKGDNTYFYGGVLQIGTLKKGEYIGLSARLHSDVSKHRILLSIHSQWKWQPAYLHFGNHYGEPSNSKEQEDICWVWMVDRDVSNVILEPTLYTNKGPVTEAMPDAYIEDLVVFKLTDFNTRGEGDYMGFPPEGANDKDKLYFYNWKLRTEERMKKVGVNLNKERIELNGKTVFKNGNASEIPLFGADGKVNPNLSAAQYLMEILKSMETVIDGGLVMAGLIAAKDGDGNVTSYLNGLQQKMYALAAGVKNFGKTDETSMSHIGFDGSAKFGHLGIASDGRVSIIDKDSKPRINITPDELPEDASLLKTADSDRDWALPNITMQEAENWDGRKIGGFFETYHDHCAVTLTGTLRMTSIINSDLGYGIAQNVACALKIMTDVTYSAEYYLRYYVGGSVVVFNGQAQNSDIASGSYITEQAEVSVTVILPAGRWRLVMEPDGGRFVGYRNIVLSNVNMHVSYKSGMQALHLAHNGIASVQSAAQAAYIRDGKLCAFGAMNIPGILLAGTVSRYGQLSNAWGEFAAGTTLQYTSSGGLQVIRLTFYNSLPCGANYVAIVNPNDDTSPYGCMPVVRKKTATYCDFRVVNDSGGDVTNVGLDFMIIGRNK